MIFYHEGMAGEVSHEASRRYVLDVLDNPFTYGHLLWKVSDAPWMRSRKTLCAPGAMASYLQHAAIRELTQGEGWPHETVRARRFARKADPLTVCICEHDRLVHYRDGSEQGGGCDGVAIDAPGRCRCRGFVAASAFARHTAATRAAILKASQ